MKSFTFITITIVLTIFTTNLLAAKHSHNSSIECLNKQLHLIVNSSQLDLTENAIVDNTGGYVDIPEERYYLKFKTYVSKLQGKVIKNSKNSSNLFQSVINHENLKTIQENKELLLIQKIDLIENNQHPLTQSITTTNIIKLSFDSNHQQELIKCQE